MNSERVKRRCGFTNVTRRKATLRDLAKAAAMQRAKDKTVHARSEKIKEEHAKPKRIKITRKLEYNTDESAEEETGLPNLYI